MAAVGPRKPEVNVVRDTWTSQSEPSQSEYTFEMGEEHLNLLSELGRYFVPFGFSDRARNVAGVSVFFTGDFSAVGLGAALGFGRACLTGVFESRMPSDTFAGWAAIRV